MGTRNLLLGVDGGGATTHALVADLDGRVLARGLGPASHLHDVGAEAAGRAIETAVNGALIQVVGPAAMAKGAAAVKFASACFGLAGVDGPADEAEVKRWVESHCATERFQVVNDSELVLAAGTPDAWGVAVISATGSVCLGRSPDRRTARAGGWGPIFGDEGSAYHIATGALRLAAQTADGRADAAALLSTVLRHFALREPAALIRHVYAATTTTADVAALATPVLDLAGRGDAAARGLLTEAARDLARHVETVARKLDLRKPPLALSGSALRGGLRQALLSALSIEVGPVAYVADPPAGAIVLARRLLQPVS